MKKRIYLVLLIISVVTLLSACRGFRSAPPCPAYSSVVEMPGNTVVG